MFEVSTEPPDGDVIVVRASGEVDMTVSATFERSLLEAAAMSRGRRVVVDLGGLDFLDSSGVHALVKGYHATNAVGGTLTVRGATGGVARVLYITGVAEVLGMAVPDQAGEFPGG